MSAHGKLFFDKVDFNLEDGVKPRFRCPICNYSWQPKLDLGSGFPATFDFNEKVDFAIPAHDDAKTGEPCSAANQKIALHVAVHKDAEGVGLSVQRSDAEGAAGIPASWWVQEA